jgi:RNA polymerase sigma-70 factor (ECF subfamily)
VALTLRALGGLQTAEIARAFLVSEETMKRRLSRAKAKIAAAGIPFAVPEARVLPERLDAVLAVLYLIYNEGYRGRVDLGAEAIRLGEVLSAFMPDEPEAHGLLALMMIHHARRRARFAGEDLVLLEDQDRSLWDAGQIAAGQVALDRAIALGGRGAYVVQAAIASLQARDRIDWPQVAALYRRLVELTGSPVVELNRAAAVAQAGDPLAVALRWHLDHEEAEGLALIDATLTEQQWRAFGVEGGKRVAADVHRYLPWLLDGESPEVIATVLGLLPAPFQQAYRDEWQPAFTTLRLWT